MDDDPTRQLKTISGPNDVINLRLLPGRQQ